MFNVDEAMAYEAKQQEVVSGIISSVHRSTRDDDNYLQRFTQLAHEGISALEADDCLKDLASQDPEASMVIQPIEQFTTNEVERKYLLSQVVSKLIPPILGQYSSAYLRETMLR